MTEAPPAKPPKMTEEEKEAWHAAAQANIQTFAYSKPPPTRPGKDWQDLAETNYIQALVQVIKEGGENNLHFHRNTDTFWFVLKGKARFYGPGDVLIGEFGPHEGLVTPEGCRYWFEKAGDEELELLQVGGRDKARAKSQRINSEAHKGWMQEDFMKVYDDKPSA